MFPSRGYSTVADLSNQTSSTDAYYGAIVDVGVHRIMTVK